jgi:hypothetical protein
MHPISANTKLMPGLIAGSAATLVAIFSIVLEPNEYPPDFSYFP